MSFVLFSSSVRWHVPSQTWHNPEVSISNPTNPWLGSWHQPMGWLPLPSFFPKAKWAHAPQRWVDSSFSPLNPFFYVMNFIILNIHLSAGKPKVRLTSDSPALNGSSVSFTAKLEYPPCQKEDANGNLVWDDHCEDGMDLEASGAALKPI